MTATERPEPDIPVEDLARLIDSSPMGYVAAAPDGTLVHVNTTLRQWLGIERNELVGRQSFQQLLAPGGRIYYETHVRPMLEMHGEVREIAVELVRRDGTRLPVLINVSRQTHPVTGEQLTETIVFDATERRRYERELILERQLAERSESRLQFLYDLVAGLAPTTTVGEVVEVIRTRGVDSVTGAICTVWLLEPGERAASRVAPEPAAPGEQLASVDFPDGGAALGPLHDGELVVIEDREAERDRYPLICGWLEEADRRSAVIAPLRVDGRLHGVIGYASPDTNRFDDAELRTVRSFVAQAEQALARARAVEAERRSRDRLASLLEFTTLVADAVTLEDVIDRIVQSTTTLLGAVGVRVALLDESGTTLTFAGGGGVGGGFTEAAPVDAATIAAEAVRTREIVIRQSRSELAASFPESPILDDATFGPVIAVPLPGDDDPLGAWVLVFDESGLPDDDDITLVRLFIDQAASAIRRARMYEIERRVAVTLQRSLLAEVPAVPGWALDTWYEPGSEHLEVGGDLYDVTALPDGRLVIIVGDVVGHGLRAAAAMGQLRSAAAALALVTTTPTAMLKSLDRFARLTPGVMYASLCCVMLDADGTGRYACAGHPKPVLVGEDGSTVLLGGGRSALLGIEADGHHDAPLTIEDGSTLVVFTDGLVERRSAPVDAEIDRLRELLSGGDFSATGDHARAIGRAMVGDSEPDDDVLVVRLTRTRATSEVALHRE